MTSWSRWVDSLNFNYGVYHVGAHNGSFKMSEQYTAEKPVTKLLADRTFSPAATKNGRISRARVSVTNNCLTIAADTGGERWTNAYLPITEWEMFAMAVQQAVVSKEPIHLTVDIYKGAQGQARLDSILGVGRDEDGILFLTLAAPQAQEVRFIFMPNQNYQWKSNGQQLPPNEISRRNAQAWVNGINRVLPLEYQAHYSTYEGGGNFQKKPFNNQKKQWNNNNGNGGNRPPYQPKSQYQQQAPQQQYQQAAPQQQQYTPPAPPSMNFEEYVGQLP